MNVRYYKQSDIEKAYDSGQKRGIRKTIDSVMAVVTLKLQDKFGFTPEQLKSLEAMVNADFNEVCAGGLTLDEIIETKIQEIDTED